MNVEALLHVAERGAILAWFLQTVVPVAEELAFGFIHRRGRLGDFLWVTLLHRRR